MSCLPRVLLIHTIPVTTFQDRLLIPPLRAGLMMFLAIGMAVVSLVMLVLSIGLSIMCVARKKRRNQGYRGLSEAMIAE